MPVRRGHPEVAGMHEGGYEGLYHDAPFGDVSLDLGGRVLSANRTLERWLDRGDLVGTLFVEIAHDADDLLDGAGPDGSASARPLHLLAAGGRRMPVLAHAMPLLQDEAPAGFRVVAFAADAGDVAAPVVESAARRVSVLQHAAGVFAASGSEDELAGSLATILEDALGATAACVAMIDDEGDLTVTGGRNLIGDLITRADRRPGREVVLSERPVIVTAHGAGSIDYPAVAAALGARDLDRVAVFPMIRSDIAIGVVAAFFDRPVELDRAGDDLVIAVAQQAAQALQRIRLADALAHLALHDQLTALPNRTMLRELITQGIAGCERSGSPLAVMFVDLDGFKAVNDRLGHNAGDAVLREVGRRLRAVLRDADGLGRHGGDEFVVVCADTDADGATAVAARLREAVRRPYPSAPDVVVGASVGVALHRPDGSAQITTDELLDIADAAMYASKRAGRDRVTITPC